MKVGLFFGTFAGGGAERMMLNLAKGLAQNNVSVTIYVVNKIGPYLKEVPKNIKITNYDARFGVKSVIFKIRNTLKNDGLTALISTQIHINMAVGIAAVGLDTKTSIVFREANTSSKSLRNVSYLYRFIYKYLYERADSIVAVSNGVKEDLVHTLGIRNDKMEVIYNPVVDDTIHKKMHEHIDHPWFNNPDIPVVIGMGRIVPHKRFEDLIKSFSLIYESTNSKLIICGDTDIDTEYYNKLKNTILQLGIDGHVEFIGFVENPFKYLKKASVFVLSSEYEGLPGVLIQAMACGCPVISTNCPSGPNEILDQGRYGKLIDIGDYSNMANAILETFSCSVDKQLLIDRSKIYSSDKAILKYLSLITANTKNED